MRRTSIAFLLALAAALGPSATAHAYAPLNAPGPPLDVPKARLAAALQCHSPLADATRDVVLLVPGTTVDPDQAYSWNYEPALAARGIPFCTITVPNHTDGDIQIAAEYVVNAVRTIRAASHHKVVMLGWSQGASALPRWALRWWPDIRRQVASLIGLAPVNNMGSVVGSGACLVPPCIPAAWQQAVGAHFMDALNSRAQTFPGIAYTAIWTRYDDVVTPDLHGSLSVLPPGPNVTNVALQDLCPTDTSDHLLIPASPTAWAIALDAIQHPGKPANLADVHVAKPCFAGTMPGVTLAKLLAGELSVAAPIPAHLQQGTVAAEPPLRCYVWGTCATPARRRGR